MRKFRDLAMHRTFHKLLANPPAMPEGDDQGRPTLAASFHAGRMGLKGVHFGGPSSLSRAAWYAGHEFKKQKAAARRGPSQA